MFRALLSILLLTLLPTPLVAQETASEKKPASNPSIASLLPEGVLMHAEIPAWSALERQLAGSRLRKLLDAEEIWRFLDPALERLRRDAEWLLEHDTDSQSIAALLGSISGKMSMTLLGLGEDEDEFRGGILLTLEMPGGVDSALETLRKLWEEEEVEPQERQIGELRLFDFDDDDVEIRLAIWRETAFLGFGPQALSFLDRLAEPRQATLLESESYRAVSAGLGAGVDSPIFYFDVRRLIGELETLLEGQEELEFLGELMEWPEVKVFRAAGYTVARDGGDLRDRVFLHAPGDRSALGTSGPVAEAPVRHAALISADVDLVVTQWFDAVNLMKRQRDVQQRTEDLVRKELGGDLSPEELADLEEEFAGLPQMLEQLRESSGIDLEQELFPALGHTYSFYLSTPPSMLAIPEAGLIVELADPAAVQALLDKMLSKSEEMDEVNFLAQESSGHKYIYASLVNAGMPILPSFCVRDQQLLMTLTPFAMNALLARGATAAADEELEVAPDLASSERYARYRASLQGDELLTMWVDMGAFFEYAYGFVGIGLSAARLSGNELFDPSLLPAASQILPFLGDGRMLVRETEEGYLYEGHSMVANPITGSLLGALGVALVYGFAEAARERLFESKRELSERRLEQIADAVLAYRSTLGGGSYPKNLMLLHDRGLLTDASLLLDPSDAEPKKRRSASGERVPVSYRIATWSQLPEAARVAMRRPVWELDDELEELGLGRDDDDEPTSRPELPEDPGKDVIFLYTRGAWHGSERTPRRLVLEITAAGTEVHMIREKDWK